MNKAAFRRDLARACKKQGLLIHPAAMTSWLNKFESCESSAAVQVNAMLNHLKHMLSQKMGPKLITLDLFQEALEQISSESGNSTSAISKKSRTPHSTTEAPSTACKNSSKSVSISTMNWRLVSAFDMPKLVYDAMRQQFHYDLNPNKSLMGTAQDLIAMRTQRYSLVKQRVVRHRQQHQLKNLMTIDRLLGSKTMIHVEHVLLGMLHSNPSNMTGCCLELEDLTGRIPLKINLEECAKTKEEIVTQLDPRGIYMDGSMVLAHGMYLENGVFLCSKLEFPPLESAAQTNKYLPPLPYGGMDLGSDVKNIALLTLFCMGNLELDDPDCLEQLRHVVERIMFEEDFNQDGTILVLFGNFQTPNLKVSAALEEIAKILRDCKLSRKHSVLIIPGPQDVAPNGCWPLPALDKHIVPLSLRDMDNVHFCSNPCRLELKCGRSIFLMRKDLIQESLQNQILSVDTTDMAAKLLPLDRRVLHHMLSQGHIMPASTSTMLQPIYWNFDHAMQLNPLPDLMIVGLDTDYAEDGLEYVRSGCRILAPPCCDHFRNWVKVTLGGKDEVDVEMGQVNSDDEE
jgi:DNA polymerase epsilon subunit 2